MLHVDFSINDYVYKSVTEDDLDILEEWIINNNEDDNILFSLDDQIFYRRYLEYYISENECFIQVCYRNRIIAIFKGRLELSNDNKLIVWLFIMDKKMRNEGLGSKVINEIIEYFKRIFSISEIEVCVVQNNIEGISFWNSIGFDIIRVTKNFFDSHNKKNSNLVVMKKSA